MTGATDRARALLAAATAKEPECTCADPNVGHDESCCPWFAWMFSQPNAEQNLREKAPATLAVAIKLADYAQSEHDKFWRWENHSCDDDGGPYQDSCKALAAWEALAETNFPAEG
jgi:hypothetical protein